MFRSFFLAASILGLLFLGFYLFRVDEYTSMTEALKDPDDVEYLNLSAQNLSNLPPEITQLKNLEILWLDNNPKLNIEAECQNLKAIPKLRALVLSKIRMDTLPACIAGIKELSILDLSENPDLNMVQVFEVLETLPEITVLSITGCNISFLPPNAAKVKSLKKIFLMNNPISNTDKEKMTKMLPNINLEFDA